jgi:DNA-binding transcriptional MerR regulator
MRIGELADRAKVTPKAVRYYEAVGLLDSPRLPNGYRDYDESDVRIVAEIRALGALGIRAEDARPFVACLAAGHAHGDDCAGSIEAYRAALADLDARLAELASRRASLARLLDAAEQRDACGCGSR